MGEPSKFGMMCQRDGLKMLPCCPGRLHGHGKRRYPKTRGRDSELVFCRTADQKDEIIALRVNIMQFLQTRTEFDQNSYNATLQCACIMMGHSSKGGRRSHT